MQKNNFDRTLQIIGQEKMGKTSSDVKYFDYFGQFKYDQSEGLGRQCVHFDRLVEGFFKNGMINGWARVIHLDGDYYEGSFKNDKKKWVWSTCFQ